MPIPCNMRNSLLLLMVLVAPARADQTAAPAPTLEFQLPRQIDEFNVTEAPEKTRAILTKLVLAAIPREYENDKKWGTTKEVWDGVKVRVDGLKIKTKRRWKTVRHGTWKRYRVTLVDPEERLTVKVDDLRTSDAGVTSCDLTLAARANIYGRLQEWRHDIRLLSVSTEAWADVLLKLKCEVSTSLDIERLPPDILFHPVVKDAQLKLVQFKLQRISHADGPIVRELGDGLEDLFRIYLDEHNAEITRKINRQIEKEQDNLRLSIHDLIKNKWLGKADD